MRVVVTRPLPQGESTASKLTALGHQPVLMPLAEVHPLQPETSSIDPGAVAMVAATSANALIHAPAALIEMLRDIPLAAVGPATENSALVCGFSETDHADGNATDLADHIIARLSPGDAVLYLCGRIRKPVLEDALSTAGLSVVAVETYNMAQVSYTTDFLMTHLVAGKAQTVLLYSREATHRLLVLLDAARLGQAIESSMFLCLSTDVAEPLRLAGASQVQVAAAPNEDALIDLLSATG